MTLPSWFVIGAPKAGTTALADWLRSHPDAHVPRQKEVGFFDARFDRGWGWYEEQFAEAGPGQRAGDATPAYLYHQHVLDRMAEGVPDARVVVLLREPAGRVWSHAWYFRFLGLDLRDPRATVEAELADPDLTVPNLTLSYLDMSTYVRYLPAVVDRFGWDQVLVEFTDDLRRDPDATYARICRHLGIGVVPAPREESNVGRTARSYRLQNLLMRLAPRLPRRVVWRLFELNQRPGSYPGLPEDLDARLREHFRAANRELAAFLDRPLPERWSA